MRQKHIKREAYDGEIDSGGASGNSVHNVRFSETIPFSFAFWDIRTKPYTADGRKVEQLEGYRARNTSWSR